MLRATPVFLFQSALRQSSLSCLKFQPVIMTLRRFLTRTKPPLCYHITLMIAPLICYLAPPKGQLYSLSPLETRAMKDYIQSSLEAGIIWPSSSPAGPGFFFVGRKDKSLHPCIDYHGLNITVKNCYPLPLILSAFELLQNANIFTKPCVLGTVRWDI